MVCRWLAMKQAAAAYSKQNDSNINQASTATAQHQQPSS